MYQNSRPYTFEMKLLPDFGPNTGTIERELFYENNSRREFKVRHSSFNGSLPNDLRKWMDLYQVPIYIYESYTSLKMKEVKKNANQRQK
ncbi:MAG TPA: hypothetical protein PKC96_03940 [Bacilli bacterium]|nr:hypothetical protein [Bacilli bacterium]